jgi:hypothetical protein
MSGTPITEDSKRGRPRAPAELKRSEQVCLRMTTQELQLLDRAVALAYGKARNTVLISLITRWALQTVHRLGDEAERKKWPTQSFQGILDEHFPAGAARPVPPEGQEENHVDRPAGVASLTEAKRPDVDSARMLAMLKEMIFALESASPK